MITQNTSNIVPFDAARRISDHSTEKERENMARATLEALVGTLPDPEWQRMRARLLDFVSILRTWQREFTMSEAELLKAA